MSTAQLTVSDTLVAESFVNHLVDELSSVSFEASSLNLKTANINSMNDVDDSCPILSTDNIGSSQKLSSSDNYIGLSSEVGLLDSETITESEVLEVFDADDTLALDFKQPQFGDQGAIAPQSSNSLYNDPIEFGTPFSDAYYWRYQQGQNSCAVVAQISVYQSLTGYYVSESAASAYAQQQGWFDPLTGTLPAHTGNLLNAYGISTYQMQYATLGTLQNALAQGDKPIVGLDANEIWNPYDDWYGNPVEQADAGHAVWVTGIDYESDGSIGIILNDSGTPSGQLSVVDYHDFMNAWQDYNYFVAIADNPFT